MFFLSKTGFYYLLFYIYTILHLYGRRQASPFSYIEYFQLSLYLICYYQTKQGWIFIHPYQDYIYNRLLGNDGATCDAISCELRFNLIDCSLATSYHFDGFEVRAAVEHVDYVGDFLRVPTTYIQRREGGAAVEHAVHAGDFLLVPTTYIQGREGGAVPEHLVHVGDVARIEVV